MTKSRHKPARPISAAKTLAEVRAHVLACVGQEMEPEEGDAMTVLREAVRAVLDDVWPLDHTAWYEAASEAFDRETGMMAPGKSYPVGMDAPDEDVQRAAWQEFRHNRRAVLVATLRAALDQEDTGGVADAVSRVHFLADGLDEARRYLAASNLRGSLDTLLAALTTARREAADLRRDLAVLEKDARHLVVERDAARREAEEAKVEVERLMARVGGVRSAYIDPTALPLVETVALVPPLDVAAAARLIAMVAKKRGML